MLSRNKVAVPEGAAGTPPFWSVFLFFVVFRCFIRGEFPLVRLSFFTKRCETRKDIAVRDAGSCSSTLGVLHLYASVVGIEPRQSYSSVGQSATLIMWRSAVQVCLGLRKFEGD